MQAAAMSGPTLLQQGIGQAFGRGLPSGECSAEFDQVQRRKRSARELHQPAANSEGTEIDTEEAETLDQRTDLGLRRRIVARIEEDTPPALGPRIAGDQMRPQVVECLDEPRPR